MTDSQAMKSDRGTGFKKTSTMLVILTLLVLIPIGSSVWSSIQKKRVITFSNVIAASKKAISDGDFESAREIASKSKTLAQTIHGDAGFVATNFAIEQVSELSLANKDIADAVNNVRELVRCHQGVDSLNAKNEVLRLKAVMDAYRLMAESGDAQLQQIASSKRLELQGKLDLHHERPYKAMEKLDAAIEIYDAELGAGNLLSSMLYPLLLELQIRHGGIPNSYEAIANAEKSIANHLGKNHPVTLKMATVFGSRLETLGDQKMSVNIYSDIIQRAKGNLDPTNPIVTNAMLKLGFGQCRSGLFDDAKETFSRVEELIRTGSEPRDWYLSQLEFMKQDLKMNVSAWKTAGEIGVSAIQKLDACLSPSDDWRMPTMESREYFIARLKHRASICFLYQGGKDSNEVALNIRRSKDYLHESQQAFLRLGLERTRPYIWVLNEMAENAYWDQPRDLESARGFVAESIKLYDELDAHGNRYSMPRLLRLLGTVELLSGNTEKAIGNYKRSIDLCLDNSMGDAWRAMSLRDLGVAYDQLGNSKLSVDSILEAIQIYEEMFKPSLFSNTSDDARTHASQMRNRMWDLLKAADPSKPEDAKRVFNCVSKTKGVVIRSVRTRSRALASSDAKELIEKLKSIVQKISAQSLRAPDNDIMQSLTRQKEAAIAEFNELVSTMDFQFDSRSALEQLDDLLPERTVLVEFCRQRKTPYYIENGEYFAFVVSKVDGQMNVVMVNLGRGKEIDDLILEAYSEQEAIVSTALASAKSRGTGATAATSLSAQSKLKERVWDPIKVHFGDSNTILMCGDGELGKISWAGIRDDATGKFLMDQFLLPHFNNSREVIDVLTAPEAKGEGSLLVGGLDYGKPDRKGPGYLALPETMNEINELQDLALPKKVWVFSGSNVTEALVSEHLQRVKFAYFATHGIVVKNENKHPFSKCALVLSNANQLYEQDVDGLISGEEINLVDLTNLDFVILSACNLASGEQLTGDGILTIQKSMILAGARSCLANLWAVKDNEARVFMNYFARNLFEHKMTKIASLRAAQQQMVAAGYSSDSWANWRLTGDWR